MLVFCSSGGNAHGLYRTYAVALLLAYIGFGDTYVKYTKDYQSIQILLKILLGG